MSIWNLTGNSTQIAVVERAIDRCDFDFNKLLPSLNREGKQFIRVDWEDLSRYGASTDGKGHEHVHSDHGIAHPIEREVDSRKRVMGLFYLPPYTRIVLDTGLTHNPELAQEVFLAECAHAVDYHFMTPDMRRAFVNSVHNQQLPTEAVVGDGVAFYLDGHVCSWFEVGAYADWVGEAFMEGFIEGTSDIACTVQLNHPVGPEDRAVIRDFLGIVDAAPEPVSEPVVEPVVVPVPEPVIVAPEEATQPSPEPPPEDPTPTQPRDPADVALATALRRFMRTARGAISPRYLRDATAEWLSE